MTRYSSERKESILKKLLPPLNMTVAAVARQEGVSAQTLYNWRDKAKKLGILVPGKKIIHRRLVRRNQVSGDC